MRPGRPGRPPTGAAGPPRPAAETDQTADPPAPVRTDDASSMHYALATALPARPTGDPARNGLASTGEALDPRRRHQLEQGFGQDLGDVRVHTNDAAAESARLMGARAFTVGPDVVFGAGRYQPGDADGWRLLSHEIAHVLQQRGAPASDGSLRLASESGERAAQQAADALSRGEPAPMLASSEGLELARDVLTIDDFDEPDSKAPAASPADDEDAGMIGQQKTPFSTQLSKIDPSVVLVPIDATREEIARELKVDVSSFYVIGAMEARPPQEDLEGIRFYDPADIPPALLTVIRARLDAALPGDVQATVDALVAESGGWTAAQYVLRWSQFSRYQDANGRSYLDRYFDLLEQHEITTTTDWLITSSSSSRTALDELLAQTGGDVHVAVLRARGRSGRAEADDPTLSADAPLPLGHVVGRWVSGRDAEAVSARVATVLMTGVADRQEAEIRIRNADFIGDKVMIASKDGLWYGYGVFFYTSVSGSIVPPVVGGAEELGQYYWYYPSTVFIGFGETDPNGPACKPQSKVLQSQLLSEALAGGDVQALVSLDYGVLRLASTEQRVEIFRRIVGAGFSRGAVRGYSVDDAVQLLARTVLAMEPGEFVEFERRLDAAGVTAQLLSIKDARFGPLGAAFTFQTMAGTVLGPGSFADPVELVHGAKNISDGLEYFVATTQPPATGGAGTTLTFEYGHSPTDWEDTPAWQRRSRSYTRALRLNELVSLETITPSGTHRRIATAFEAALTQGNPESEVSGHAMMDFLNVLMLVQGGLGLARLGGMGLRAFAAGNLRAAMRVLATELATEAGKTAVRSVVDLALFTAAHYASAHQEELEKTPEGRAFLAILTGATVLLAARDIGALVESGAIERLIMTGRKALTMLSEGARVAVRRTMLNFRAARLAWNAMEREGLLAATNVGGFVLRLAYLAEGLRQLLPGRSGAGRRRRADDGPRPGCHRRPGLGDAGEAAERLRRVRASEGCPPAHRCRTRGGQGLPRCRPEPGQAGGQAAHRGPGCAGSSGCQREAPGDGAGPVHPGGPEGRPGRRGGLPGCGGMAEQVRDLARGLRASGPERHQGQAPR